tara:strand:- start:301 stop:1053 length:753 start_codon:yes stop_codon:yes gene_type:complete
MNNLIILTGCSGNLGSSMLNELLKTYYVLGISRKCKDLKIDPKFQDKFIPLVSDFSIQKVEDIFIQIKKLIIEKNLFLRGLVNNAIFNIPKSPLEIDPISCAKSSEGLFAYHVRLSIMLKPLFVPPSSIINITSMYGKVSPDPSIYDESNLMNPMLYGSFKAALIQSSKYLSSIFGPSDIRVNSVSYGPFPSEKVKTNNPDFIYELTNRTHLKRIGNPTESVGVIKFLLSENSSYITGTDIAVDGGWTAW